MMVLRHASLGFEMIFQYSTLGSKEPKGERRKRKGKGKNEKEKGKTKGEKGKMKGEGENERERFGGSLDNPEFNISKWPLLSAPSIEGYGGKSFISSPSLNHQMSSRPPF
ncbi:hypothetical protein RhiirC2_800744 [Rhizophagus irregularis]|uniref:Uncharacterized protein n=1 Tax=Rhizophagus irregularis TaxID=588596 RepID=A0A2N1M389_9GLOM|nr:hypothetical protein RhiirC2_800744 [Rhizophagus irregularis]